jgi:hypothetical protein
MATVQHRQPVVVRHPGSDQFVTLARGMEFADSDPIVAAFAWAFEPDDAPREVTSVAIEAATAAPGEKRSTRR